MAGQIYRRFLAWKRKADLKKELARSRKAMEGGGGRFSGWAVESAV
jgi:hypothetical protein